MGYFYFYLPNSIFNASLIGKSRQIKSKERNGSHEKGDDSRTDRNPIFQQVGRTY